MDDNPHCDHDYENVTSPRRAVFICPKCGQDLGLAYLCWHMAAYPGLWNGSELMNEKNNRWQGTVKLTQWFPKDTYPIHRGLYERDWRDTDIIPKESRVISLDFWEPVTSRRSNLYPGVWYVGEEMNDASYQNLPWRGVCRE